MSITYVSWSDATGRGYDLHILQGHVSRPLSEMLFIKYSGSDVDVPASSPKTPANVTVEFKPTFLISKVEGDLQYCQRSRGDVVTVDKKTGQVSVKAIGKLKNFIVEATVTEVTTDTTTPVLTFKAAIRVHLHQDVTACWLTPARLTVNLEPNREQRFTVLAVFDDGTTGNVTYHKDQSAVGVEPVGFEWTVNPTGVVYVDPTTEKISVAAVGRTTKVKAKFPAGLGNVETPEATVACEPGWDSVKLSAELVGQRGGRSIRKTNFLFLPDGFVASEARTFIDVVVRQIVEQLTTEPKYSPYNVLSGSINYWAAFIASPEAGGSVLNPLGLRSPGSNTSAMAFPKIRPPSGSQWTLENLLYRVGLPVPADQSASYNAKLDEWKQLFFDPQSGDDQRATQALFDKWKEYAYYVFPNECDTAFGLVTGTGPRAGEVPSDVSMTWHPLRKGPQDLGLLLAGITDARTGDTIGPMWIKSSPGANQANVVVIISAAPRDAGGRTPVENGELVAASLKLVPAQGDLYDLLVKPVTSASPPYDQYEAVPYTVPNPFKAKTQICTTIGHEIGHAFALTEEYGGKPDFPDNDEPLRKRMELAHNVQTRKSLTTKITDGKEQDTGLLISQNIRWLWPRIATAGVLLRPPEVRQDGKILLALDQSYVDAFYTSTKLHPDYHRFGVDDYVRVRTRWLLPSSTKGAPQTSVWLKVAEVAVEAGKYELIAEVLQGAPKESNAVAITTTDQTTFAAGSTVFRPVIEKDVNDKITQVHNLVAKSIFDHINGQSPLNAYSNTSSYTCHNDLALDEKAAQQQTGKPQRLLLGTEEMLARNLPPNLRGALSNSSQIIGLYDSGGGYFCGIYHPSGDCIMRRDSAWEATMGFCHVCSYVLVDQINPTLHSIIDAAYAQHYGKL